MSTVHRLVCGLICAAICVPSAEGYAHETQQTYSDEHVIFSYPTSRYAKARFGEVTEEGFYTYYLEVRGAGVEDTLTACKATVDHCGLDTGSVKPYWYSVDGSIMLFSSTTTVNKRTVNSGGAVYEAFPACPATDDEGSSAYGGDCYELVEASPDKTLSITYWIGPKSVHRSRKKAVEQAKSILKSIVVK